MAFVKGLGAHRAGFLKNSTISCVYVFLLMLSFGGLGCGSAIEGGEAPGLAGESESTLPISFAQYQASIDPFSDQKLAMTPIASEGVANIQETFQLINHHPGFLAMGTQVAVTLSNWQFDYFDPDSNTISITTSTNMPCTTNASGMNARNFRAEFTKFDDNNAFLNEGSASITDGHKIDYQDAPNGVSLCRPWRFNNTSSTIYNFQVQFLADSVDANPVPTYVSSASVNWTTNDNTTISGSGFGTSSPTIQVNGANATPIHSSNDTLITYNPTPTVTDGFLTVTNNDTAAMVNGPYVTQHPRITGDFKLADGQPALKSTFFWRICDSAQGSCSIQSSGCVANVHDSGQVSNVTLNGTTRTTVRKSETGGITGAVKRVWTAFDMDQDGMIDTGDVYTYVTLPITDDARLSVGDRNMTSAITGTCP